ncbi:hypothetical protein LTR94_037659, partial [Friedmanniomyces endolithicus]
AWTIKGGISTGFRAPELRQVAEGYAYTTGGATCTVGPTGTCGVIIGDPDIEPVMSSTRATSTSLVERLTSEWAPTGRVSSRILP